jgi:hypothetical protein
MNQAYEKQADLRIDFREQRSGIIAELEKFTDQ